MGLRQALRATFAAIGILLLVVCWAAAQSGSPASKHPAQAQARPTHRLVIQVNTNDPATMNLAINNAMNVEQYYKALGQGAAVEVVAFGPGLHMLRDDTSPVKDRLKAVAAQTPAISFKACGNTKEAMTKAEGREIPIVAEATVIKSGVVRIMELQEQGWSYLRP